MEATQHQRKGFKFPWLFEVAGNPEGDYNN